MHGPLRLLKEKWLSESHRVEHNVLDYVCAFKERLSCARQLAHDHLKRAQGGMKARFDKKSVVRTFAPGEKVLVLLPVTGSNLRARFSGPYEVDRKISDTNYVVKTPDRKTMF